MCVLDLKYFIAFILFIFGAEIGISQNADDVLFNIDGKPIYTNEFIRIYNKNLDLVQEDLKDVDEYLKTFINYKLKVYQAYDMGLDEKPLYVKELNGYKKELAQSYLTDNNASEKLLSEAYDRLLKEIDADHILVKVDIAASPEDTLAAFNKILEIRKMTAQQSFDVIRDEVHDGVSVFGEKLGYFSVFRMVYPFENVAYRTAVGEISQPFRTQFGYHILKVNGVRPNRGEVEVAHIMVSNPSQQEKATYTTKGRINEIYAKLKQGEDFAYLAKRFSDDRGSAANGGRLLRFGTGKISSAIFEDVSFSLGIGEISKPFETEFGWHIVKVLGKFPIKGFEEEKMQLEEKIKKDNRSDYITEAFVNKVHELYTVKENTKTKQDLFAAIDESYTRREWQKPTEEKLLDEVLLTIEDEKITNKEFSNYLYAMQFRMKPEPLQAVLPKIYDRFVQDRVMMYHENNLENVNEEYASVIGEYREGLLLFDLMQEKIWDKARLDSVGLKKFFDDNSEDYFWRERAEVIIASCTDKEEAQTVKQLLGLNKTIEEIKGVVNTKNNVNVIFTTTLVEVDDDILPEGYECVEGSSKMFEIGFNDFVVIKTETCIPAQAKTLDEARANVISDYQTYLEDTWLKELRNGRKIEVNQKVLNNVKKILNKRF